MGFLRRLSIQSKLLLMLLGVSIASIMVVAYFGYESGRRALVESIRSQLSGFCQVKSTSIQNQLKTIKGLVRQPVGRRDLPARPQGLQEAL